MRTVLWDMDGTIADNEEIHFHGWMAILAEYRIDYDHATYLADFGRNNSEILNRLLGSDATPARVREISKRKEAAFRALLPTMPLKMLPGVKEWLARFEDEGVRQVVSSSGTMANISALVSNLEIGDFFMALMSGYRLPRSKPHPAIFLNSAAAVGVTPADCIVIEDSLSGIEAARRAGMACIAVGKVIHNPQLDALLETLHGQPCLRVNSLVDLAWQQAEELWDAPHSIDGDWLSPEQSAAPVRSPLSGPPTKGD